MNKKGVRVAAITDHNTVGGVNEFKIACKKYGIKPIVGVELYAKFGNRRINLVWYNINEFNPCLHDMLRESQIRRRRRIRWSLEKLVDLGFKIKINKVLDQYTHYVPINHVVDDIMAVPHNLKKIKKELEMHHPREGDVIHEYFHNEKLNKLRESYISIERIVKLKKKIGGVLILNHPAKKGFIDRDAWIELKKMGIDGVEVLSPHHSLGAIMHIQILARELNWIETGGSDFHRFEGGRYPIQKSWDYFKIDSEYLIGVKKIIGI
ncbi:hypothetical protein A2331_05310 [Candidatus Falkowbacteria bacterium RIFOXYB2_FULL_34_18]|uniref:PHP domain-containing protein n=1 Tax=Candidatus Falkowbacteria bacterium RIFOXYD2_FULL_34_120 TaxID=1798007 RepID=A0A1F5TQU6_9BACT|nr:MAG: hypothetical protein A2331_05310 [Candidatus Falkowbacteria bacterium RIFOXYB2_FULL_34_18]OGF29473.1 MAG: hypothetical protein A2500_04175 [Candidatus Falkowbacteria bacterium RIFOXYC12_FULL_34_55]OGF36290.1 MAG: hypothetical protein A2466_05185 [Candidatus Falkowbacteria bacterium RIFOXYC2_FULL_34_220]OGF38999.1 MAG: hypothetical protein A2515_06640 [Candidatus Falkowbacteria bacterium RIFOXYD12_FULL_34_57]OGF41218.1 MAG: hypothetical protein A2531_00880 [Candidatus Falkowbacteria bact